MRAQISQIALDLCLDAGYDSTTVEQICAAAEISRTTFFRYFTSKDDALLGDGDSVGLELLEALRERPVDEPVWQSLRHALGALSRSYASDTERSRQLITLMYSTPSLAAAHSGKHARWSPLLRPEVSRRLQIDPDDRSDPRPHALICSALSCADAAITAWIFQDTSATIDELLARAMTAVAQ
ncbi:TetR family transcriptional regulator [Sciscionella sediminilitoris]|uniref:acyl-CoA-like ligand-binding transcription factor n=1 Tax=Sciscionella sediminilitoris TaxID=1445613 RepID=UPI0004DF9F17|nr:TetR family transcriptional regulator [Sciscionella sp. SE31]